MKVAFIHKTLGIKMWVTEAEVERFKAAGHKPVATSEKPTEEKVEVKAEESKAEKAEEPKKKPLVKKK